MEFDAFISYPHQDKAVADAACATLEVEGIRCWIAPRDVPPGVELNAAISDAIEHCCAMVLIFSSHANKSSQVHLEVRHAFDREKPIVAFRIENVTPDESLAYCFGPEHLLDALTPSLDRHLQELAAAARALVREREEQSMPPARARDARHDTKERDHREVAARRKPKNQKHAREAKNPPPEEPAEAWHGYVEEQRKAAEARRKVQDENRRRNAAEEIMRREQDRQRAEESNLSLLEKTKRRFLSNWRDRRHARGGFLARLISPRDLVDCTVFATRMGRPGAWITVQVFLHTPEQGARAETLASTMDANTAMSGIAALEVQLKRGARVQIQLDIPNVPIDEDIQTLVWHGHTQGRSFRVLLPAEGEFNAKARFFLDGAPIGWVGFVLTCGIGDASEDVIPKGSRVRQYTYAFISYASEDRADVKKRIQTLRALKIGFFQDILSLSPGDRWERRLYREIDRCDLFILFWSRAASKSEWVGKEIDWAMKRRHSSTEELPDIAPFALEPLNVAPPPPALSEFHFDSSAI